MFHRRADDIICIVRKYEIPELIKTERFLKAFNEFNGIVRLKFRSGKYNYLNKDGKYLLEKDAYYVRAFDEYGHGAVQYREEGKSRWNYIDREGNFLFPGMPYYIRRFSEDRFLVEYELEKFKYVDSNMKPINPNVFVHDFYFGDKKIARVRREDGLINFMREDGTTISEEWFLESTVFCEGVARVRRIDETFNFIKEDGTILCSEWLKEVPGYRDYFSHLINPDTKSY